MGVEVRPKRATLPLRMRQLGSETGSSSHQAEGLRLTIVGPGLPLEQVLSDEAIGELGDGVQRRRCWTPERRRDST